MCPASGVPVGLVRGCVRVGCPVGTDRRDRRSCQGKDAQEKLSGGPHQPDQRAYERLPYQWTGEPPFQVPMSYIFAAYEARASWRLTTMAVIQLLRWNA